MGTVHRLPIEMGGGIFYHRIELFYTKGEIKMKKHNFARFLLASFGLGLLLHLFLERLKTVKENADYEEDWQ